MIVPGVGGIVLCGGESRRMGTPKAWLRFGTEFLLQRIVRQLADVAEPVLVVAAPGQELPELPASVAILRDSQAGRGPLQGLADGLANLAESVEFAYLTSTDAPFLAPGWVARLARSIGDHDLAIVESEGYLQPLAALYRREPTLLAVERMRAEGSRRLSEVPAAVNARVIGPEEMADVDPGLMTLRNVNTPAEYRQVVAGLVDY